MAFWTRKIVALLLVLGIMLAPLPARAGHCCQQIDAAGAKSGLPACPHCRARLTAHRQTANSAIPACCQKKAAAAACCQQQSPASQAVAPPCCCQAKPTSLPLLPAQTNDEQRDVLACNFCVAIIAHGCTVDSGRDHSHQSVDLLTTASKQQILCRWLI